MADLIFGSARFDERGLYSGGLGGDQNKKEVTIESFYMHNLGWVVFRPATVELAEGLASSMMSACHNDYIGYNQSDRLNIITVMGQYNNQLKDIRVPCQCDCGTIVRACCIQNGFDPGDFYTANEAEYLARTGKFENRFVCNTDTVLFNGDILVTQRQGHTGIIVSGRSRRPVEPQQKPLQNNNRDIVYIVKKGDTLSKIATAYNTTYQKIAAYNNISNPNRIYVNQQIRIKQEQSLSIGSQIRLVKNAPVYGKTYKFNSWVYETSFYVSRVNGNAISFSKDKNGEITGVVDRRYIV